MKISNVLRKLTRQTPPVVPSNGLLTTQAERDGWRTWFTNARTAEPATAIFDRHPNAGALRDGFTVGAYLTRNHDVFDAITDPTEAVFHYLEFGFQEGRIGRADTWNASFVERVHGHKVPPHFTAAQASSALQARDVPVAEITLNERDLWLSLGLYGPALAPLFHHEMYLAALEAEGQPMSAPDRIACIRHFAQTGLYAGLPAHPDHTFDPTFYAATLAEMSNSGPASPRHWAREGLRIGAHANATATALAVYGLRLPPSVTAGSAQDLAAIIARPNLDVQDPATRRFAIDLARHKRASGDTDAAQTLLSQVHAAAPNDPRAAVELADLIHGTNQTEREIALRQIPPADFDSGANRVTLAELTLAQGHWEKAIALATSLPAAAQSDVALRRRARNVGRAAFDALWSNLPRHVEQLSLPSVQNLLADALTLYAPPPDLLPRSGAITRVAILANDDIYQCKLYRADQKADQLRAHGLHVRTYLQSRDVAALHADLAQFDAVIFQRTPAFPHIADVMVDAARQGLTTFYDIDDLIFDTAHFPPPLETYAGQINAAQHDAIACGVPLFAAAARLCAVGIASTDPIREALAPLTRSGTAFTHKNALGGVHMAAIRTAQPPQNDKLVLFYGSGTKAHKAEFTDILEPALAHVLAERPGQVEIRLMGDFPDLTHLAPDDVTVLPPIWDFECFTAELAQADIALSILQRSAIADAKSEIKWSEPAMFAIPAIVSPTPVMSAAITDGETGMLAETTEDFATKLLQLIDDPALRTRIGKAAQTHVMRDYALPKMGADLVHHMHATRSAPKPKLLVVNVFYPPQDIGGATRVVADNVSHLLAHHDFEIDILTTFEGGGTPHQVQALSHSGARIWAVTAANGVDEHAMRDPVMDARIDTLLDKIAPDIVHVHCVQRLGVGIIDACRTRGIPYVLTLHDGWWSSPNQFIVGPDDTPELYDFKAGAAQPERVQIAHRALTDASACLAVSEPFAALHRDIGLTHVTALPNGVSSLPKRIAQPHDKTRVRLAHIGGASRHKGFDLLRTALTARAYRNLDLLIVDHALPPGAEIHEMWNTTPVRRIPRQPKSHLGTLYGSFDVLMAPSIWPESFGLVTREALALGLWVVASDRGAVGADISEGENGHIVPVDDHRALAEVLARMDADAAPYTTPTVPPTLRTAAQQGDELAALYTRILADNGILKT